MARTYLGYIVDTLYGDDQCDGVISKPTRAAGKENERDLILGGWSLGGMVSLEVAKQVLDFNATELQREKQTGRKGRKLNVMGIVMIDSMNPSLQYFPEDAKIANPNATTMQWGPHTKPETKEAVLRCFNEARRMLGEWTLPTWSAAEGSVAGIGAGYGACTGSEKMGPPPVVLLKCKENVPLQQEQKDAGEVSRTDVHRRDDTLGWGKYDAGMVRKVIEVEGNHFNLFTDTERAEVVTKGVREACEILEGLWKGGKA